MGYYEKKYIISLMVFLIIVLVISFYVFYIKNDKKFYEMPSKECIKNIECPYDILNSYILNYTIKSIPNDIVMNKYQQAKSELLSRQLTENDMNNHKFIFVINCMSLLSEQEKSEWIGKIVDISKMSWRGTYIQAVFFQKAYGIFNISKLLSENMLTNEQTTKICNIVPEQKDITSDMNRCNVSAYSLTKHFCEAKNQEE